MSRKLLPLLLLCSVTWPLLTCAATPTPRRRIVEPTALSAQQEAMIDDLEHRSFLYFWELADPQTLLVPDRAPTPSFSSVAAEGYALAAYAIGAERGWITREQARDRVLATLQAMLANTDTHNGFYYHFLDMKTGKRYQTVELSTIDSGLLFAGALFCQSYFDRSDASEQAIRDAAETLYTRADWKWASPRAPLISMGWRPEDGFIDADWHGLNEAMFLEVLAIGSPTHPADPAAWSTYTSTFKWVNFYGQQHVGFAPLFGHQSSQIWIDFRGIRDAYGRDHDIDYFENSRRAALSQHAYAIANPGHWTDYGDEIWGLSASDGPGHGTVDGRTYIDYIARGASTFNTVDDGTIAPTAAAASIPFTPEESLRAIAAMKARYGDRIYGKYGLLEAFNPTLHTMLPNGAGVIDPKLGWFDIDYIGIDQGGTLGSIENYRSGLIWKYMRKNPHIIRGLQRAGFTGGWLAQ